MQPNCVKGVFGTAGLETAIDPIRGKSSSDKQNRRQHHGGQQFSHQENIAK